MESVEREAGSTFASDNPAVRLYWRNGVLWTVYRQDERRSWRSVLSRIAVWFLR
jgi:hypothetical protein